MDSRGRTVRPDPRGTSGLRYLALFALAGPIVYVVAVVAGGLLWPGYSHYGETVSTLLSRGAPNQGLLIPLFAFYNLGTLALAFGLHRTLRTSRYGLLGPGSLGASAAAGFVLFFFPQGPWSSPLSGTGVLHVVVAGLQALFFLLAMGFLWRRLRADGAWPRLSKFTVAMLLVGIVLGGLGAASVNAPYAGLAERLSIGSFLLWTEAMAVAWYLRVGGWSDRRSLPAMRPAIAS